MRLDVENEASQPSFLTKYNAENASIFGCSEFRFSVRSIVEVVFIPDISGYGECHAFRYIKSGYDC